MAVRFKERKESVWVPTGQESADGHNEYYTVTVPIREWQITPENISSNYTPGGNVPHIKMSITFPELSEWSARDYDNVIYEVDVLYQGTANNWLDFKSPNLIMNRFSGINPINYPMEVSYRNLSLLPKGIHTASIIIKAYEQKGKEKIFIENSPPVRVNLNVKESTTTVDIDLVPRNIIFNKSTWKFSGDLPIEISDISFNDVKGWGLFDISLDQSSGKSIINFKPSPDTTELVPYMPDGIYNWELELLKEGKYYKGIPIIFNLIDGTQKPDFSLTSTEFDFVISKTLGEQKMGSVSILNPLALPITLGATPSFLENIQIKGNELTFQTKSAEVLDLGKYSGEIVLHSGSVEKRVKINLKVIRNIESDFKDKAYYFALDPNQVKITKTNPKASYVTMILEMYYRGYGKEYRERQEYAQHYFGEEIIFYPGEEIQDFFIHAQEIKFQELMQYQFSMASVNIIIKEFDAEDHELSEARLNNLFFVPGKKPKCFPFFTDFAKRRTFPESKIRINTDALTSKRAFDEIFSAYSLPKPTLSHQFEICSLDFERKLFNANHQETISAGEISFIPFPNPPGGRLIHLFFENQNLVLDWLTCTGDYHRKFDFTHITNETNGEKFGALETETLVLNTGWILREEIELINALIKSSFCFIIIKNKIIKARPMNKKNEIFNTAEQLYSTDLEFNIKQNER